MSTVLVLSFGWYTGFGTIFGLIACIIQTSSKKITEALAGLHDLLDLLTHGVVEKIPRFSKNIPRNQLEDTFDGIGKNFLEQLKLKRGVTAFLSRILFGTILKVIKFFFLDNVVEELSKKETRYHIIRYRACGETSGRGNGNSANFGKIPLSSNPQLYSLHLKLCSPNWDTYFFFKFLFLLLYYFFIKDSVDFC